MSFLSVPLDPIKFQMLGFSLVNYIRLVSIEPYWTGKDKVSLLEVIRRVTIYTLRINFYFINISVIQSFPPREKNCIFTRVKLYMSFYV